MSASLYPVLERDVAGYDASAVVGKALCHAVYHWNVPEVAGLEAFFSVSPQEVAALAGYYLSDGDGSEDCEDSELKPAPPGFLPPAKAWYELAVGLSAVGAALRVLREAPPSVVGQLDSRENRVEWVINDLEAVKQVLMLAQENDVRFHLAMDF